MSTQELTAKEKTGTVPFSFDLKSFLFGFGFTGFVAVFAAATMLGFLAQSGIIEFRFPIIPGQR